MSRTEGGTEVASLGAGSMGKDGNYEVEIIDKYKTFFSLYITLQMQEEQPYTGKLHQIAHLLPFICLKGTRLVTLYISLQFDRQM